jgi:hypothetical protein
MKKLLAVALALVVSIPVLAFAGGATNAALGLGAFAVFNQMLSGVGIFGGLSGAPAVAAPVVVAPPAPVVYAPPPVVYAPPPVVYAPPPVVYAPPAPVVYVRPAPVVVVPRGYYAAPIYRHGPHSVPVARGWCQAKHGRC